MTWIIAVLTVTNTDVACAGVLNPAGVFTEIWVVPAPIGSNCVPIEPTFPVNTRGDTVITPTAEFELPRVTEAEAPGRTVWYSAIPSDESSATELTAKSAFGAPDVVKNGAPGPNGPATIKPDFASVIVVLPEPTAEEAFICTGPASLSA